MQGINPIKSPALYNFAVVGGSATPGIIPKNGVSGFKRSQDWEQKKGKGNKGATSTANGAPLAEGSLKLLLWRTGEDKHAGINDFDDWDTFRDNVLFKALEGTGKEPEALDFTHPYTTDLRISAVTVKSIGQIVDEGGGLFSVTIELIEYRKPEKSGGTPAGAKAWTEGKEDANAAQQKEIDELLKKAQAA